MRKSESDFFDVGLQVRTFVDPTKTFTVVNIYSEDELGKEYIGTGVAKRNPEDDYDPQVGFGLAVKRALYDLADNFSEY
jgi:hypothetical protein